MVIAGEMRLLRSRESDGHHGDTPKRCDAGERHEQGSAGANRSVASSRPWPAPRRRSAPIAGWRLTSGAAAGCGW